jgi:hypothetical protein
VGRIPSVSTTSRTRRPTVICEEHDDATTARAMLIEQIEERRQRVVDETDLGVVEVPQELVVGLVERGKRTGVATTDPPAEIVWILVVRVGVGVVILLGHGVVGIVDIVGVEEEQYRRVSEAFELMGNLMLQASKSIDSHVPVETAVESE